MNIQNNKLQITFTFVAAMFVGHSFAQDDNKSDTKKLKKITPELVERLQIIGHSDKLRKEAGSATLIGEVELEKFKFDDINRILYNVPGVNIREEDGYGLRPNIGFRGATPERSKKITVMEDGILIGPAPYSAPAAYYFPMISKMTSLEVFKGPAAIKYGPNTVAGALNMTTRQVPDDTEGMLDLASGSDGLFKSKMYFGDTIDNFGYLVEGTHLQAEGFKELDSGENTGFNKNDLMTKLQYNLSNNGFAQLVELKLSLATEKSDETYLGLTDHDFSVNPNRRYVASQNDLMDWEHKQVQLTHFIAADNFDITTWVYRNDFTRSWNKINGFKGGLFNRDLQEILTNSEDEVNALFYEVLTGERDSIQEYEKIILGDNYREYYSQGIQSELQAAYSVLGLEHKFNVGVRIHQDQISRKHTEDTYLMRDFQLVSDGSSTVPTTTNLERTDATALFFKDTISLNNLEITVGVRGEFFDSFYQNQGLDKENDWLKKETSLWLPSISGFYTLNDNAGLLFGVHEGFVPTSPQESPLIDIENSINYEFGGRFNNGNTKAELIVFYNDIKNLKEGCSFSAAASCGDSLDEEFNGGEVDVYGVEFSTSHNFRLENGWNAPISLVYTYTDSEFNNDFYSDFPMWGAIQQGDHLPYLPHNQLTANLGILSNTWEVSLIARYIDEMLEASGDDVLLSDVVIESYAVLDFSASYDLNTYGLVYFKADNLLDKQVIVSRRPYGARPSKPQQFQLGYQYRF